MSTKDELRQIDQEVARMRAEVADLRDQIGDMGATDEVEKSAMINMADEQDGRIAELEGRREELLRRLGEE
jgi:hypothetical protein